ncbi:MAG: flavodoxin family protein [Lachnospiraceae bacterium]|nr:flavodoxin family protein [Lachnospiraceae bacterium]
MKKIVAINASPRIGWNTSTLVKEAAEGARKGGATVEEYNLYSLDKYNGCMSCFACKLAPNEGKCIFKDGLAQVLQSIREADGLIIGTPNYLGDVSAGFKALYERLIFQSLTYKNNPHRYPINKIPVLFIMTSNAENDYYEPLGYKEMLNRYAGGFNDAVGDTKIYIAGNTLQVKDYSRFDWDMFNPEEKQKHHETVFQDSKKEVYELGVEMVKASW